MFQVFLVCLPTSTVIIGITNKAIFMIIIYKGFLCIFWRLTSFSQETVIEIYFQINTIHIQMDSSRVFFFFWMHYVRCISFIKIYLSLQM